MARKTVATEAQVRARLAAEGAFHIVVQKGERAWDPISKTGWTRGAGMINYFPPEDDGFVAAGWSSDNSRGSDLHYYDYGRRHGVRYL